MKGLPLFMARLVILIVLFTVGALVHGDDAAGGNFAPVEQPQYKEQMADSSDGRRVREVADPSCLRGAGAGESYGEEMEIELGFLSSSGGSSEGKVYKDKYNYASLDCAATIVQTNSEASGATSILIENKDKYLLNPCSAENQYVVIELCEDILVEEVKLGNFEYFSSTFHNVRFYVSDRLPVTRSGWTLIGSFEAENSRQLQAFEIENPQRWARYLRIEVLSHYGNEFYCPISSVKVHGQTMMDEFKLGETEPQAPVPQEVVAEKQQASAVEETEEGAVDANVAIPHTEMERCADKPGRNESQHAVTYPKKCPQELCCKVNLVSFLKGSAQVFAGVPQSCMKNANCTTANTSGNTTAGPGGSAATTSSSIPGRKPTEDSIFKNMMRRLASLEHNSTQMSRHIEQQQRQMSRQLNASIEQAVGALRAEIVDLRRSTDTQLAQMRQQQFILELVVVLLGTIGAAYVLRVSRTPAPSTKLASTT
ncbi:Slp1 protein [Maudiozyma humilis]|uniref:SUN-like protein 1 n=1 Tax=Maudiozyma humilis TaxID=51915 RepID=A0AAV5RYH3_MAUHU|nr:Slp1 protein [Kazachstania humilis]